MFFWLYPLLSTAFVYRKFTQLRPHFAATSMDDTTGTDAAVAVQIKLPIIQVYIENNLDAEFVMGNDVKQSSNMLTAYLKSKSNLQNSVSDATNSYTWPVENIYTDTLLQTALQTNKVLLLKLYRVGCKKCASIESFYDKLATESSQFKFAQANINHIPQLTKATMARLKGETKQNVSDPILDCLLCNNTGFLPCLECASKGYVMRKTLAVTCPTCVGYKKNRCSSCGGKCLKCEA